MGRAAGIVITLIVLLMQSSIVTGSTGQVLKVVDGDTFMMEVAGAAGQKTIEVNLRCSDAPIISAPFGTEAKQYLEGMLHGAEVHFKVQAYCGSENCVEVLAYIPDPTNPQTTYINTQMIAAGMARNDSCRGVFSDAETQARADKKGIWSTTKKIVFAEPVNVVKPGATKSTKKPTTSALNPKAAPALIEVDRAERTVTLKSREMPVSKAIKAIDTVSTLPVSLYLVEEQRIYLSLDKVSWYEALQHIVDKAGLKQVNMNGKIDLYDQLFYYKHIAPYLKLSDNDGVYINAGSGGKEPVVDDGVTRYVFINDFENSAAEARQRAEDQSGFVQVHQGSSPAPVSNYGRFEVSEEKKPPVTTAAAEPTVAKPPSIERPALKPYSGEKISAEQEAATPVTKKSTPGPVKTDSVQEATVAVEKAEPQEAVAKPTVSEKEQEAKSALPAKPEVGDTKPVAKAAEPEPVLNIALNSTELVVLLIVVLTVVFGSVFLSRSAARRAAKAEKSIDPTTLNKKGDASMVVPEPVVDEEYEKEVFEDIEHIDSGDEAGKTVDEIFKGDPEESVETSAEDEEVQDEGQTEESTEERVESDEAVEEQEPEEEPAPVERAETVDQKETEKLDAAETKQDKPAPKKVKGAVADEGNYAVTLDDYDRLMNPPKREPRMDCLFEVNCSLGEQSTTGIGLDISSGGIFVDSKEHFAAGKVLDLSFKLREEDQDPIRCRGVVSWVNERPDPIKPNYPNGFGIHFLDVDTATEQAISDFLSPAADESADETEDAL